MVYAGRAYEYAKEQKAESQNKKFFPRRAVSTNQHGLGVAHFAKRVLEIQHHEYTILQGFGLFVEAPVEALQSVQYPDTFPQSSLGELWRLMLLIYEGEEAMKEETSRSQWILLSSAGAQSPDKRERDAGIAW